MKELTREMIRSGLISEQSIELLKMWRCLPEDITEDERLARTSEQMEEFVRRLEKLLESERELPELRETDLDLQDHLKRGDGIVSMVSNLGERPVICRVIWNRYRVCRASIEVTPEVEKYVKRGTAILTARGREMIVNIEPRYEGEVLRFYECDVQALDNGQKLVEDDHERTES